MAAADKKAERRQFFSSVLAHGSARVISKVASAPLERVKVCLQVGRLPPGALPALRQVVAQQGGRALWRGSGAHIAGVCAGGALRLGALRTTQMWAMPGGDRQYTGLSAYGRRCAFLYAAGAGALLLAYPFDVAYTCLAADTAPQRKLRGFFHFAALAYRHHGALGLYRGLPLCLLTALPFVAVATAVHDLLAPLALSRMGQAPLPRVDHILAQNVDFGTDLPVLVRDAAPTHLYPWNLMVGAASGFAGQAVTYPLDTVRRRWQHTCSEPRSEGVPRTLRGCAERVWAEGGWRALYAGFGANAVKLVPELAVLSGTYFVINSSGFFV